MKELKGLHHVTAITSSAEKIYEFFTYVLGMRLVKKTVNQDDIQTYHLYFTDDVGAPGTDMTFLIFLEFRKVSMEQMKYLKLHFVFQMMLLWNIGKNVLTV